MQHCLHDDINNDYKYRCCWCDAIQYKAKDKTKASKCFIKNLNYDPINHTHGSYPEDIEDDNPSEKINKPSGKITNKKLLELFSKK